MDGWEGVRYFYRIGRPFQSIAVNSFVYGLVDGDFVPVHAPVDGRRNQGCSSFRWATHIDIVE
jgi:hypothetical protein